MIFHRNSPYRDADAHADGCFLLANRTNTKGGISRLLSPSAFASIAEVLITRKIRKKEP
jgi:hypothetical protein